MPSGVILCTASYDRTIRFWDATSGLCHQTIQLTDSQVNTMQITNNKSMLAAACHHIIKLFDLNDHSPSNSYAYSQTRHHQQMNNQQQQPSVPQLAQLEGHTANIVTLGFPVDDQWMYSGGEDCCIKLWDLGNMSCQRTYKVKSHVNSLSLHPNQVELVSGEENGCLRVWDLTLDQCVCLVNPLIDSTAASEGLQPPTQQQQQQKPNNGEMRREDSLHNLSGQPDHWSKNNVLSYSAQTGHFLKYGISSVSVSPDGQFVCASNHRGQIFVYRLVKVEKELSTRDQRDYDIDSEDEEDYDTEHRHRTSVTNLQFVTHFQAHNTYILKIQISPDSAQLATCSADGTVKLWDLSNVLFGAPVHLIKSLNAHKKWVWDCCYSSDSLYLVTCSSDMGAKLWDVGRGDCIKEYKGHQKAIVSIALNDLSNM